MAAAAQNAVAAATSPGIWTKVVDNPYETLISFERYIRMFKRFMNVSGLMNLELDQKCDLLICTGGTDMEDLVVYNAKVVTEGIPAIPPIQAVPSGGRKGRRSQQRPASD